MKVLVIGGSRFIGRHLVLELLKKGHEVTVFNRGKTPTEFPEEVHRLYGDRKDYLNTRSLLKGQAFDAVFDLSAYISEDMQTTLEALEGRVGHYIFCSSTFVYAPSDVAPISENHPLDRRPEASSYVVSKIKGEELLFEAWGKRDLPISVVRPSMVYGPHNYKPEREYSFFTQLLRGRKILVPGDGLTLLHFGHVYDLARYFVALLGNEKGMGQAYNVTGPEAITINGYIQAMAEIVGVEADILHLAPEAVLTLERPVFPYEWQRSAVYSIDKIKEHTGLPPQYDIFSGLRHTYEWYLDNDIEKLSWDFSYEEGIIRKHGSRCSA